MTRSTRRWLDGILRALFSGVSGVFGVMIVDPTDFNFSEIDKLGAVAALMGTFRIVEFLAKTPTPPDEILLPVQKAAVREMTDEELARWVGAAHVEPVRKATAMTEQR